MENYSNLNNKKLIFVVLVNLIVILFVMNYYHMDMMGQLKGMKTLTLKYLQQKPGSSTSTSGDRTLNRHDSGDSASNGGAKTESTSRVSRPSEAPVTFRRTPLDKLNSMSLNELYDHYLRLVNIPTTQCHKKVRYGNKGDGGWEVCHDKKYAVKKPCLVYSMGINWDFSFDDAISKTLGCVVHSFDPSMKTNSFNRSELVHFHNYGIKGTPVNPAKKQKMDQTKFVLKNFGEMLTEWGHRNKTIDVLKMDVEGPEWPSIDFILRNNLLDHVRQFSWEVHIFRWEFNRDKFLSAINVLERLREAGFEMYMVHQNPTGVYLNKAVNGRKTPCCYECYYLNTKYRKGTND